MSFKFNLFLLTIISSLTSQSAFSETEIDKIKKENALLKEQIVLLKSKKSVIGSNDSEMSKTNKYIKKCLPGETLKNQLGEKQDSVRTKYRIEYCVKNSSNQPNGKAVWVYEDGSSGIGKFDNGVVTGEYENWNSKGVKQKSDYYNASGQTACGVKEPIIKIKFLKKDNLFPDRPNARMYFYIENKSDALIDYSRIKISLYNKQKVFLRTEELTVTSVRGKANSIFNETFDGVSPEEISSWSLELVALTLQTLRGDVCRDGLNEYKLIEEK